MGRSFASTPTATTITLEPVTTRLHKDKQQKNGVNEMGSRGSNRGSTEGVELQLVIAMVKTSHDQRYWMSSTHGSAYRFCTTPTFVAGEKIKHPLIYIYSVNRMCAWSDGLEHIGDRKLRAMSAGCFGITLFLNSLLIMPPPQK